MFGRRRRSQPEVSEKRGWRHGTGARVRPGDTCLCYLYPPARALRPQELGRGGGCPEHAHRLCCGRAPSPGAGTRGGAKLGRLPPRVPMYAFYSLLIYIFYSLFRRDGGAAAAADPRDPAQVSGGGRCAAGDPLPERGL